METHRSTERTARLVWVACGSLLAIALVGCAASRRAPEPDQPATAPTFEPIDGARLLPLEPWHAQVRITEGGQAGQTRRQQLQRFKDHWTLTLEGRQRLHLRRDAKGRTVIFREDDFQQNVSVHYEPALVLLPARVTPAITEHEQQVDVTVRHLDSGQVRDRGTCRYEIASAWRRTAHSEQGKPMPAYMIEQRRELKLPIATADVRIETVYLAGVGRVAWTVRRRTQALGLIGGERVDGYAVMDGALPTGVEIPRSAPAPATQPATRPTTRQPAQ